MSHWQSLHNFGSAFHTASLLLHCPSLLLYILPQFQSPGSLYARQSVSIIVSKTPRRGLLLCRLLQLQLRTGFFCRHFWSCTTCFAFQPQSLINKCGGGAVGKKCAGPTYRSPDQNKRPNDRGTL